MVTTVEEVEGVEVEDFEGIWLNPLGMKGLYRLRDGGSKRIGPIVSRHHLHATGNEIVIAIEIILAVVVVGEVLIGRVPGDLRFLLCHRAVTTGDLPTGIAMEAEVVAEGIVAAIGGEVGTGIAIRQHHGIGSVVPVNVAVVDGGVIARVPIQHQYLLVAVTRLFLRQFRCRHQWKTMSLCRFLVMHENHQFQHRTPSLRHFTSPRVSILPLLTMLLLLPPCLVLLRLLHQRLPQLRRRWPPLMPV